LRSFDRYLKYNLCEVLNEGRSDMDQVKIAKTIIFIFFVSISLQSEVYSMSLFSKLVFFSEVHGIVLDHGQPIMGADIERSFKSDWRGKNGVDYTRTDKDGKFHFGAVAESSVLAKLVPHQPVISQKILIKLNGKAYEAWLSGKTNYDENGELNGKPINMICDIATEPSYQNKFYGICRVK
jgi:hypothetical protein